MITIFIGGSRHVARLSADVRRRIDKIVAQGFRVVVGDANGADKAVQSYLHGVDYRDVEVFCSGTMPRNNLGNWRVRSIDVPDSSRRDRAFYTIKDRAMTTEASYGFMVWDGKSLGTLMNVARLLKQSKKAVLYLTKESRFVEFDGRGDDLVQLAALCPPSLRDELRVELSALEDVSGVPPQMSLLDPATSAPEPKKKRVPRRSAALSSRS